MPEQPSWPDDGAASDAETAGIAALARAALASPVPAPDVENQARQRALAQFQEMPAPSRRLHWQDAPAEASGWVARLWNRLRRK